MSNPIHKTDFSDFHRFSWQFLQPPPPPLVRFLTLLPFYLLTTGLLFFFLLPGINQNIDTDSQHYYLGFIITICLVLILVFHAIGNRLYKTIPAIIKCQINNRGLTRQGKLIPFSQINSTATLELITPQLLPQESWQSDTKTYHLTLLAPKPTHFSFHNHTTYQHFLRSLHHYLTQQG